MNVQVDPCAQQPCGLSGLQVGLSALPPVHPLSAECGLGARCGVGGQQAKGTLLRKSIHKDLEGWALPSCRSGHSNCLSHQSWEQGLVCTACPRKGILIRSFPDPGPLVPRHTAVVPRYFPQPSHTYLCYHWPTVKDHLVAQSIRPAGMGLHARPHSASFASFPSPSIDPGSQCHIHP